MSHHFDAVIVPGGSRHVQRLAGDPQTARFMRGFMEDNKPVALFEDAVKIIAVDDLVAHRSVVGVDAIKEDLLAKDAELVEANIFVDNMLVTAAEDILPLVEKFANCIESYVPEAWEAA